MAFGRKTSVQIYLDDGTVRVEFGVHEKYSDSHDKSNPTSDM